MRDSRTRTGGKRGCLCAAGAACAAAIALSGSSEAQPPSPRHDSAARGAEGVIVQYEEAPGSNVLYLEEKGGMVSAVAPPAPAGREPPAASPARKAQAVAEASPAKASAAPTRAQRRVARPDGAGNRP